MSIMNGISLETLRTAQKKTKVKLRNGGIATLTHIIGDEVIAGNYKGEIIYWNAQGIVTSQHDSPTDIIEVVPEEPYPGYSQFLEWDREDVEISVSYIESDTCINLPGKFKVVASSSTTTLYSIEIPGLTLVLDSKNLNRYLFGYNKATYAFEQ